MVGSIGLKRGAMALPWRRRALRERSQPTSTHTVQRLKRFDGSLEGRDMLAALAAAHGQLDIVQDLPYFLQKPGLMRRMPNLLLVHRPGGPDHSRELAGALLVQEFRPFAAPTGAFAVSDRSGRSVVVGAPEERLELALRGCQHLLRSGARMVLLTFQGQGSAEAAARILGGVRSPRMQWAVRTRSVAAYLPLGATLDATYASLGQKTRSNLRYYRRRAEQELKCRFLPEAQPSLQELIEFNAASMFPQSKQAVRHRLEMHGKLRQPFLMGLQDGNGRWLSLVAGRRFGASTEILWQMNRGDLPKHSIVSAMRSYLMEHEIGRGTERLYIEGGTPHSMQHSFAAEEVTDVICIRPRLRSALRLFVQRHVPTDNVLAEMVTDPATVWHNS